MLDYKSGFEGFYLLEYDDRLVNYKGFIVIDNSLIRKAEKNQKIITFYDNSFNSEKLYYIPCNSNNIKNLTSKKLEFVFKSNNIEY